MVVKIIDKLPKNNIILVPRDKKLSKKSKKIRTKKRFLSKDNKQYIFYDVNHSTLSYRNGLGETLNFFNKDNITVWLSDDLDIAIAQIDTCLSSQYYWEPLKNLHKPDQPNIYLYTKSRAIKKIFRERVIISEAENFVRDLSNLPANYGTPKELCNKIISKLKKLNNLSIECWNKKKLKKNNMNLMLSVAQASKTEPTMSIIKYKGSNKKPICLIGKGVTFDLGGANIKMDEDHLWSMKYDKVGATTVAGIIYACAKLKLPINLIGFLPFSENLLGSKATLPGDVITSKSGINVEIYNTDAEGRLLLADAIELANNYKPELIIDIATLTGQADDIFGGKAAVAVGDKEICDLLKKHGNKVDERVHDLPLYDDYIENVEDSIADIKNSGYSDTAQVLNSAAFLSKFPKYKWCHLDIAGVANSNNIPYIYDGATGYGIRLFVNFLKEYNKSVKYTKNSKKNTKSNKQKSIIKKSKRKRRIK